MRIRLFFFWLGGAPYLPVMLLRRFPARLMITQDVSLFPSLFIQPMNAHTEMFDQTQILIMMIMMMMMMMMTRPSIRSIYRGTASVDFERFLVKAFLSGIDMWCPVYI